MKYKIPTNLDYTMLASPEPLPDRQSARVYTTIGCKDITSCKNCVLCNPSRRCSLIQDEPYAEEVLNRLVEYKVITKVQALDLLLIGKK